MDWLTDLDWPMLLVALGMLLNAHYTRHLIKRTKHMAGEVSGLKAEVARAGVVAGEAVAKIQALHDASAAGIDPADVVAATEALKAANDMVAAKVEEPTPPPTPAPPVAS